MGIGSVTPSFVPDLHSTDPAIGFLAIQSMFRRQLESVRRSVAAARAGHISLGRREVPVPEPAPASAGTAKAESSGARLKKKKKKRTKKSKDKGRKTLLYWEALMKVDPSLTKAEAKKLAQEGAQ